MSNRIPFDQYYEHALRLNNDELQLRSELLPQLPSTIIDSHVHASAEQHYDETRMTNDAYNHMMSTFPVTSLEHSALIDRVLMPDIEIRKIRFAHAYSGIAHFAVTRYLLEESPEKDAVAAFGLSDSKEQIERTIDDLRTNTVSGLKMYYLASGVAKSKLYDYFPEKILGVAEEEGKPIILHLPRSLYNSHDEVVDLVHKYPDLKIVLAHLGVAHIARQELPKILDQFAELENVHADTSQVHDPELISKGISHLGIDRLLYGSDEPLNLLRSVVYEHRSFGPRILTDFPYHWVNKQEHDEYINSIDVPFVHSQWQQLNAILEGMKLAGIKDNSSLSEAKQKIFYDNAARVFDLNENV